MAEGVWRTAYMQVRPRAAAMWQCCCQRTLQHWASGTMGCWPATRLSRATPCAARPARLSSHTCAGAPHNPSAFRCLLKQVTRRRVDGKRWDVCKNAPVFARRRQRLYIPPCELSKLLNKQIRFNMGMRMLGAIVADIRPVQHRIAVWCVV